jgi:hypothetical protein
MNFKELAVLTLKVAAAYAVIAAFQKHVMVIPGVGAYLPKAGATGTAA